MSFSTRPARGAPCPRGLSLGLSCILALAAGTADRERRAAPEFPRNVRVDDRLTDVVAAMLLDSPTFRAQCSRLEDVTRLRLRLTIDPRGSTQGKTCRAECVIRRYEYGFIDAVVRLRSVSEAAELIAHEFEHVLEYVEGLNYRAAAHRQSGDVWMLSNGHFETTRAIAAGRRVAAEILRSRSAARLWRTRQADATR